MSTKELQSAIATARELHEAREGEPTRLSRLFGSLIRAVELLAARVPQESPGEHAARLWHEAEAAGTNPIEALTRAGFTVRKVASEKVEPKQSEKPATFDNGLVDRLQHVYRKAYEHTFTTETSNEWQCEQDGIRAILSEFASMPNEMPTADEYAESLRDSGLVSRWIGDWTRPIKALVRTRLGPILAAKDAEIESTLYNVETQRNDARAKVTTLEKRLAHTPVDATGKTPGDVAKEAFSASVHAHHESEGVSAWEASAKAVLRAFGGAALRRVRKAFAGYQGECAAVVREAIDDELAKLGQTDEPEDDCHACMEIAAREQGPNGLEHTCAQQVDRALFDAMAEEQANG